MSKNPKDDKTSDPSTRRLALAISAATAATTIAVTVTAGSLLGWFHPVASPSAAPEIPAPADPSTAPTVIELPAGLEPQLAAVEPPPVAYDDADGDDHEDEDDDHEREHRRGREHRRDRRDHDDDDEEGDDD